MSVQNEKLIEEAAKAIWSATDALTWEQTSEDMRNSCRVEARAAMAVFEKAHTPTDDELRDAIDHIQGAVEFQDAINPEAVRVVISAARRSEEPSAEVLSDWFTSSHGVAVAAVKPMTDRGPSVMVDGRVISPNDVAALIEFKAQGEPSDAQIRADAQKYAAERYREVIYLSEYNAAVSGFVEGALWKPREAKGEPSDAQEAVRRLKDSGVGAYMILAAVTKVYDMETKP